MKDVKRFICLFVICLLVFSNIFMGKVNAQNNTNSNPEITPYYVIKFPVNGDTHIISTKTFAKVEIDGIGKLNNFTQHNCACGAQIFKDGYPYSGYVGRYFYKYYDAYIHSVLNMTVYKLEKTAIKVYFDKVKMI